MVTPKWTAAVLVCRDCRKRRNGPPDVKPKLLAKLVRHRMKTTGLRPRVVLTNCLSVCPKGASAVAFVGFGSAPGVACVESYAQMEAALDEPAWSRTAPQVD